MTTPNFIGDIGMWDKYYSDMASGVYFPTDVYVVNQKGRGLGNTRNPKHIYKVQRGGASIPTVKPVMFSPAAQGVDMAKKNVQNRNKRSRKMTGIKDIKRTDKRIRTERRSKSKTSSGKTRKRKTEDRKKTGKKSKKTTRTHKLKKYSL